MENQRTYVKAKRINAKRVPVDYEVVASRSVSINDYIGKEIERQDRKNILDVQNYVMLHLEEGRPLPGWMEFKVEKNIRKCGLRRGEILADLARSVLSSANIAKSAKRQSIAENTQFSYLRKFRGANLVKLPTNGPGSIRLHNAELYKDSYTRPVGATKTFDAVNGNEYIYMKYINEAGGAQDNQLEDGLNFVTQACFYTETHNDDVIFTFILDGKYGNFKKHIFDEYTNDRVKVVTSDTY